MSIQEIEKFLFFKGCYGENLALIDISLFLKWMDNFSFMSEDDMADREEAFREYEKGETVSLKDAMVKAEERSFRISRKADKFIRSLPERKRKAVKEAVTLLIENKTENLNIKRLFPNPKEFRLRIDDIRVLFKATKDELFIFKAVYRGEIYKK